MRRPIVISLVSKKGGVGKTSSAVNITGQFAQLGYRTLVVDLDEQCNATGYLGVDSADEATVYDVIVDRVDLNSAVRHTVYENLDIIPADARLENAVDAIVKEENRFMRLLAVSRLDYDFVIIDCPGSLNSIAKNGLVITDYILVPILVDQFGLEGFSKIMDKMNEVKNSYNPNIQLLGAFLTKDDKSYANREIKGVLKAQLNDKFLNCTIRNSRYLVNSTFANKPVIHYAPKSTVSADYRALAGEILEKLLMEVFNYEKSC